MLHVQLANFFVSDLTIDMASHDSFWSIKTPRNLILETSLISVDHIIIEGFISWLSSGALNYIQSGFYIWFPLIWAYTVLQDAISLLMQISSPLDFRIYFLQKCA